MKSWCTSLYEGTFSVGLDKKFFSIPRRGKAAKGALKISLNPFLVVNEHRIMLIDTGIGSFGEDTGVERLFDNLERHGIADYEVTDIFISHLHYDHMGGLAHQNSGFWELSFPKAKLWISKDDWVRVIAKEEFYDAEKTEFIAFLDARANIHFLEAEDQPYPELQVERIGGHTQFHQALWYKDEDLNLMMAGDVMATRTQVNRVFAAKYDYDPEQSKQQRVRLARKAYEKGSTILAYHDEECSMFRIVYHDPKLGYVTEPVRGGQP
tara:strand:- start:879 stop:1676 length:798 start_codon:yes stop_codon:yes gene_type:complete